MAHFKRKKANPKQDEYLGWTAEGKIHHDLKQPQLYEYNIINVVRSNVRQRRIKHKDI